MKNSTIRVLEQTASNTYRLDVPSSWRAFSEFNVERLRRYFRRPPELGGDEAEPPVTVPGLDGQPEHEVAAILKFAVRAGRPQVLIRWARRVGGYMPVGALGKPDQLRRGHPQLRAGSLEVELPPKVCVWSLLNNRFAFRRAMPNQK